MTDIEHDDHADIRDAIAKLCAQFPGEYWRKLDREMAYPGDFVDALTKAGYLSVLIPEEYGGAGLKISAAAAILEEIHRAGCNAGACHAQVDTPNGKLSYPAPAAIFVGEPRHYATVPGIGHHYDTTKKNVAERKTS